MTFTKRGAAKKSSRSETKRKRPPVRGNPARKPGKPSRGGSRNWLAQIAKWTATIAVWGLILTAGAAAWYAYDLPDVDKALAINRRPSITLLSSDGMVLASVGDLYGSPAHLANLPPALPQAVLATEDRRFRSHFGIDLIGLARAAYTNIRAGYIRQGGSTITQQVAKNLFLTPERTIKRKVQEIMLALWLEYRFTKDQILTVYLNRVYLGSGAYGVEAAARKYFGKSARYLTTYQAAMLAGLLKAPSRYNPLANPKLAARRTNQVLANMVDAGYLTPNQAKKAKSRKGGEKDAVQRHGGRHFADWVLERVTDFITPGDRDLTVITTLDSRLQRFAETAVSEALNGKGAKLGVSEAALVAMTPDGAVRAMVGGRSHSKSQFNRATQALRQPGSAFKPIVFLAGLEAGLSPDSRLKDEPLTVDGWSPRNFKRRFRGEVTLREALAKSINTVAVKVAEYSGRERVVKIAHRLGLTADLTPAPSLALGSSEISLTELTSVYAVFANGGYGVWAHGIEEIRDAGGRVIYARTGSGPGRVVAASHVAAINDMLSSAVTSGTGRAAAINRPAAGKTGTSQEFRDAWFIGYSANLTAGVWMGNDNGRPMKKVTGGSLPAKVWREFMTAAHKGVPVTPLPGLGRNQKPEQQRGFWQKLIDDLTGN